jgi:hypothetical protein
VVSAVKAAEKKKKRRKRRKRRATCPPAVVTPSILTPRSSEVESENEEEDEAIEDLPVVGDRLARRSESPAAKRQQELVEKTSEDATQARIPSAIRSQLFRPKLQIPIAAR